MGRGCWALDPQPKTEKQEQITIPRKTLQRTSGGVGFGEKSRPCSLGLRHFSVRPFACTESLSDEESHRSGAR